jgi:hypothetical protein
LGKERYGEKEEELIAISPNKLRNQNRKWQLTPSFRTASITFLSPHLQFGLRANERKNI